MGMTAETFQYSSGSILLLNAKEWGEYFDHLFEGQRHQILLGRELNFASNLPKRQGFR